MDTHFPISKPMVGHTVPGVLRRYPVKLVNNPDYSFVIKHRKVFNPVKRIMPMGQTLGKEKLADLLQKLLQGDKKGPELHTGYKPAKENLEWKGNAPDNLLSLYD